MKATLKSIEIIDFRKINQAKIDFTDGENWIEKPNKYGKTATYDVFCWVVFGKNANGDTRFTIESNNVENPKTKVTVTLDVDGQEIILCKEIGKWSYNGHEVKKTVFEDLISAIYNVSTLEFLTNPLAFMNLHWETRRNHLTGLFCARVEENPEFSFLMKSMNISDIRKSKTQQKKAANDGLKKCITTIEAYEGLISEAQKVDFGKLKAELSGKQIQLKNLSDFDWKNYNAKESALQLAERDSKIFISEYKATEEAIKKLDNYE